MSEVIENVQLPLQLFVGGSCPLQQSGKKRGHKKWYLQTFDLIDSKSSGLADLLKVYSLVRVGHLDVGAGEGVEEEAGGEWADGLLALRCT